VVFCVAQVRVFGSFATGLYLPSSDVDVVVLNSGCQARHDRLKALAKALTRSGLAKNIQVIANARVPIIKFVETRSNIPFDISFDVANGPEAADFIKAAMEALPPLRPLCLVLKIFLQQRELNEVYQGGIGSYALLVMLLTHLQMHPSKRRQSSRGQAYPLESNLGILLVISQHLVAVGTLLWT
jgi:non-canonical poly(A) RNA polymerase PAPD5/7